MVLVSQRLAEQALAEPLVALLGAPDVAGHAIRFGPEIPPVPGSHSRSSYSQKEKGDVTRQVNLAAALYRLGNTDGKGEAILKAYADDPRGFCTHYARRVLADRRAVRPVAYFCQTRR